jgi:hypothetical protein
LDWRDEGPREELIEPAVGMALDDAADDVGEIGLRVDAVQRAGLDGEASTIAPHRRRRRRKDVLAVECDGPDGSRDDAGSISTLPASTKRLKPSQRASA